MHQTPTPMSTSFPSSIPWKNIHPGIMSLIENGQKPTHCYSIITSPSSSVSSLHLPPAAFFFSVPSTFQAAPSSPAFFSRDICSASARLLSSSPFRSASFLTLDWAASTMPFHHSSSRPCSMHALKAASSISKSCAMTDKALSVASL